MKTLHFRSTVGWQTSSCEHLPPRTLLFGIEPCGRGTGLVESITSFLARLAQAHCVSVGHLLIKVISPLIAGGRLSDRNRYADLFGRAGNSFDGNNETVADLVETLEELTGRQNLAQTTFISSRGYLSPRDLIRDRQAWCPRCLEEWRTNETQIYLPLLWHLKPVRGCPVHECPLVDACPYCSATRGAVTRHSKPGFCPACDSWLGDASCTLNRSPIQDWDRYVASQCCRFIEQLNRLSESDCPSRFGENLRFVRDEAMGGNKKATARNILHARRTIDAWCDESQEPTLRSVITVGYRLDVDPIDLLVADVSSRLSIGLNSPDKHIVPKRQRTSHRSDPTKLRAALETALSTKKVPPPSIRSVADKVNCHQSVLTREFPELVAKLKSRSQHYAENRKRKREQQIRKLVRSATNGTHAAGDYPSAGRVRAKLPSYIDLRDPVARQEWIRARGELGLGGNTSTLGA